MADPAPDPADELEKNLYDRRVFKRPNFVEFFYDSFAYYRNGRRHALSVHRRTVADVLYVYRNKINTCIKQREHIQQSYKAVLDKFVKGCESHAKLIKQCKRRNEPYIHKLPSELQHYHDQIKNLVMEEVRFTQDIETFRGYFNLHFRAYVGLERAITNVIVGEHCAVTAKAVRAIDTRLADAYNPNTQMDIELINHQLDEMMTVTPQNIFETPPDTALTVDTIMNDMLTTAFESEGEHASRGGATKRRAVDKDPEREHGREADAT